MDNTLLKAAWQKMIEDHIADGWSPYFVSIMFNPLAGPEKAVMNRMKGEISRIYKTVLIRTERRPRAKSSIGRLPIFIAAPDLPVYKRNKLSKSHAIINDGLHWHMIVLIPPASRMPDLKIDFNR